MVARLNWRKIFAIYSSAILAIIGFLFYKVVNENCEPRPDFFEDRMITVNPTLTKIATGEKIFLTLENGWLKARLKDGSVKWSFKVALAGHGITDFLIAGPETFFVSSNGNLYKVLTSTGEVFWMRMWRSRFSEVLKKPMKLSAGSLILTSDIQTVSYSMSDGKILKVEKNEN